MRILPSLTAFVLILPNVAAQPELADLLRMEEEVELLHAHLATRKAHLKAAITEVQGAKPIAEFAIQALERGTGNALDASRARTDLARAEALVEIRECELREVEVKLKFARQRLENAKKAARPAPPPVAPAAIAERVKLAQLKAAKADLQTARAETERAKAELQRAKDLVANNVVGKEALQAAEAGFLKAQAAVRQAELKVVAAEAAVAEEKSRPNPEDKK